MRTGSGLRVKGHPDRFFYFTCVPQRVSLEFLL
jgi:hypothetical protein